ncbi:bifunctional helix-turn-helix transcriptional regulator/GNAT family N-acetyltransferase [Paraneptunicella aestuarii]|uniref:bifunctional helix-turn-helix transcriptional regulator/GNAT family N-acetyltransferase n=1 Tax=Paraneptunicella aestuarii TaxID=2831148 RepID=UPI001E41AFAE|nr:bifunctional helix-turn-helix transcriptional regulator/GNAT family N-acetyltransferase [Paraneptunicella aestuarii]UAA38361.1 bifunctional helix-turn-helix transcriptional regulator/GNAT family N-acetyltransferase [Paraneptunicella aestuarii]
MKTIEELGAMFLGTRLKRLSDTLYDEIDNIYSTLNINLKSRWTAVLFLLHENGDSGVTQIAEHMGLTHPAISQMSRKLLDAGYIESKADDQDERRRLLGLTDAGKQLTQQLTPIWEHMRVCLNDRIAACQDDLLNAISNLEQQQIKLPLSEQILQLTQLQDASQVEIIPYSKEYAKDFKRLNIEWLEKYFYVEEIDDLVLSKPKKYILNKDGQIFFARYNDEIVGTCALLKSDYTGLSQDASKKNCFELTKMAVTEKYQGLKIGRKLMEAVIDAFHKSGGDLLFLESNSRLKPALHLYESMGFVHKPKLDNSHYQRADVYMEYVGK